MIKDLATYYAERDNCVILVVTSMKGSITSVLVFADTEDDIDNQAAGEIARKADPLHQRTIGYT